MNKKRLLSLFLACLLALSALVMSGCTTHQAPAMGELDFTSVDASKCVETNEVTDLVKISIKDYGDVIVRLYPNVAPETVANFQNLVSEHFYDGLTFHRVKINFVIQAGDPKGDGTGGSSNQIEGEFSSNGFENNLKHIRGVLSMARRKDNMNSASSQFFIVHQTTSSTTDLNGDYASFGYVVSGMDVVDAIAKTPVKNSYSGEKSVPVTPVVIDTVRFVKVAE